jgi:hypothetical protein
VGGLKLGIALELPCETNCVLLASLKVAAIMGIEARLGFLLSPFDCDLFEPANGDTDNAGDTLAWSS